MSITVALTTYGRHERQPVNPYYDSHIYIPSDYIDAVRRAGAEAVLLPSGSGSDAALLKRFDAVIVIGGCDIHPERYQGNDEHPHLTDTDLERDASDLALMEALLEMDIPTLCICRGLQVLNVAMGGTLYEHVADVLSEDIHRAADGFWNVHEVEIAADSKLATAMQAEKADGYSGHHQAIKDIAPGLRVSAYAPDGVIEAVEHISHPWMLAVQWHPEKSAASNASQQHLFDALVSAAQERKQLVFA